MIQFDSFFLDNGLRVIVHEDPNVQVAVLNLLYDVGSKDEHSELTGLAHLFEHLMFGGSKHVEKYDEALQKAGGENNAFTSPDITNYYLTLPAQNIETGFWLESDRMLGLSFDPKVLEVQRNVVIEEFKQRYLNQPYGDVWMNLRPLAYRHHPYQWPTIGKDIGHIEKVTMEEVKSFFYQHYVPNNATLVVAGNVKLNDVKKYAEKWFGPIPFRQRLERSLPAEEKQVKKRAKTVTSGVPMDALYMTFHMPGRFAESYHASDLLSDVLGRDKSSRLYQKLVREEKLFNSINAHVMGSIDPGLLVINGKLNKGTTVEVAEQAVWHVIDDLKVNTPTEDELIKVKNQAESTLLFGEAEVLNRALNLAMTSLSGNDNLINEEADKIRAVSVDQLVRASHELLTPGNASVLYYLSESR